MHILMYVCMYVYILAIIYTVHTYTVCIHTVHTHTLPVGLFSATTGSHLAVAIASLTLLSRFQPESRS